MKQVVITMIKAYKILLSPFLGANHCRFFPTCSQYAIEAIEQHGLVKGTWLSLKRIGKCQPLHAGGVDTVPKMES